MEYDIYNLIDENKNSDNYYKTIIQVSNEIKDRIINNKYIIDFMSYIIENNIEPLRTRDEYSIEFLMIGVMIKEYSSFGSFFIKYASAILKVLNKLRNKEKLKNKIDILRGILISKIIYKKNNYNPSFEKLIKWMDSSGEFKEEIYRLNNWLRFYKDKDLRYQKQLIAETIDIAQDMFNICDYSLSKYLVNLDDFLDNIVEKYKNREDLIYCSKGKIQYYFNMVSAEIMNQVYRKEFLNCKNKKIFAPACMRQQIKKCNAIKEEFGYQCRKCNKYCNIYKIAVENNIQVFIIPHESTINKIKINPEDRIGIIGIACITNLMSGGWKALRLGFIPQCVILDYCGCKNHWLKKEKITSVNEKILISKLN